jgi:hypothetical protein
LLKLGRGTHCVADFAMIMAVMQSAQPHCQDKCTIEVSSAKHRPRVSLSLVRKSIITSFDEQE